MDQTNKSMKETTESLKHLTLNFTMDNARQSYFESEPCLNHVRYLQKWMRKKVHEKMMMADLLKRSGELEAISSLFTSLNRSTTFQDITGKLQNRPLVEQVVDFLKIFDGESTLSASNKKLPNSSSSTTSSPQASSSSSLP